MTENSRKYLSDILMAIDLIEDFTSDIQNFNQYEMDLKTQSAVERQLAIVGEALNQFKKGNPNIEIANAKQIISFRNRIVHAYDNLDNSIVWVILNRHLGKLKLEIQILDQS